MSTDPVCGCGSARSEVRGRRFADGRWMLQRQCLDCGQPFGPFLPQPEDRNLSRWQAWDDALQSEGQRRREKAAEERRQQWELDSAAEREATARWKLDDLSEYYATPEWRAKSLAVLHRDKTTCQAVLPGFCLGRATQAHHRSYRHLRNEPLFELVAVCKPCHDELTRLDREART
jgi:5-methylcytosine-specific restriction endonuclease McrA